MTNFSFDEIARSIDHVLLHPALTDEELIKGCAFAVECNCASVWVKPGFAGIAAKLMRGTGVAVGTVVGFPFGFTASALRCREAELALDAGVDEIVASIDSGKVRAGEWATLRADLQALRDSVVGAVLKVIFDIGHLTDRRIEEFCSLCNETGADFLVTSSGAFFPRPDSGECECHGATVEHLALMRRTALPAIGIEASGGIRTLDDLLTARRAGASRIATVSTRTILEEAARRLTVELEKRAEMEENLDA